MIRLTSVYEHPSPEQAANILYDLLRERSTEEDKHVNISHRALPTWRQHTDFIASRSYHRWWIIEIRTPSVWRPWENAGSLSITKRNEIGIVLKRRWRGQGIGKEAIAWLLANERPLDSVASERLGRFVANINPANERSIRLFTGMGAVHLQNTYQFSPPEERA